MPDLVIMSIDTYEKYQAHPKLKERFLDIEFEQSRGAIYYSLEELDETIVTILN